MPWWVAAAGVLVVIATATVVWNTALLSFGVQFVVRHMPWWVAAAGVLVVIATAAWWWVPKWQVDRLSLKIRDPKARADLEDNFRKTIGQLIGGAAVLIGIGFAYYQSQLQITSQQVTKGFELLGDKNVMNSSEQYQQPVLEALSAFVRDGTKARIDKAEGSEPPAIDIQAALTVIGRRAAGPGGVDLSHAHLSGADLSNADLHDADLSGAYLTGADLSNADLIRAHLRGAHLSGADLTGADIVQDQLNLACGDEATKLPSRLTLKPCP